eukprot:NODE_2326_length_1147_cov_16.642077_g1932_i0.p1 GENE.NODE_2326_length_1147_cov_16.642077_g1932_i0~~NODE_2326_length_1147_cov_16.642077_g1932_i0.p1  ORF type:complete len:291 (+),score=59.76 NODE_2326_length_1147_cov_16.642077_g1932_i0:165-1037(+)
MNPFGGSPFNPQPGFGHFGPGSGHPRFRPGCYDETQEEQKRREEHNALRLFVEPPFSPTMPESTGTTQVSCVFNGGVVFAADTRTTMGQYVAGRDSPKIMKIAPNMVLCRAGASADTQNVANMVQDQLTYISTESGDLPLLKSAANVLQYIAYRYRYQLSAAFIVGGCDKVNGPQIWQIPIGAPKLKVPWAAGGSGGTYLWAWLDSNYRPDFTKAEAIAFVTTAVSHAIARDGSSGGFVRYAVVTPKEDGSVDIDEHNILPKDLAYTFVKDKTEPIRQIYPGPTSEVQTK